MNAAIVSILFLPLLVAAPPEAKPLHSTVDLKIGEAAEAMLKDGSKATIKLLELKEARDSVRSALREAHVKIEINGKIATLVSGNYRLPVSIGGVQLDCPATKGLYQKRDPRDDSWGLDKDARLRIWPEGSSWMPPAEFGYPIRQRWFASSTQMSNEPSHVDGGDAPTREEIYYHSGLDIGGCEGMAEVISATDGTVVSAGQATLPGASDTPVAARYDVVYIRDSRDWFYRYSHLKTIEVKPGETVKMGQKIGLLGKEGSSGGWSHLHFEIKSRQPSGKWGTEDGYAFLWEAYQKAYKPKIIAVARPHHLIWEGEKTTLDGSRSWSSSGTIKNYEWTFTDGTTATGPRLERKYDKPGEYSEILKVVDAEGNVDYDFAVVLVIDRKLDGKFSPTIHASYAPTFDIRPGDPITFKVRTFQTDPVGETWDFGDGSPAVRVRSDANANRHAPDGYAVTVHRFAKAGHYLIRVDQSGTDGATITSRLHIHVEAKPSVAVPDSRAGKLHVGGATVSITPDRSIALAGQMHTRVARDVESPVTATALALESREGTEVLDQAILISCDLVAIDTAVLDQVRRRVKGRLPDFDGNKLLLSATHTHTAPVMKEGEYEISKDGVMQPAEYAEFLSTRVADAAVKAWESRQPGRAGWGLGHAVVAQNRRAVYSDGRAQMYGLTDRPEFRGIEGSEDQGVEVLFFWDRQGKLVATAVNVACPSQEVEGGSAVNADFWHEVRESLRARHGRDLLVLGWTGAAGDQSPHLMYRKRAEERMRTLRGLTRLQELSRRIVEAWEEAYEGARKEQHADAALVHKVAKIKLPVRPVTEAEFVAAKSKVETFAKEPRNRRLLVWHQEVVERYTRQKSGPVDPFGMELHVIRLGDVAIATNVFELFTEFGIQMKARSRALQTFVIQLAGPGSYVPTARALRGGGYSAIVESNVVGPEGGQVLTDRTVELINSLWPGG